MQSSFFLWWSIIATVVSVILGGVTIWQITSNISDKLRHKDQVKIWYSFTNGLDFGLKAIIRDHHANLYTGRQDVVSAIAALEFSAHQLSQSLFEERYFTEKESKKRLIDTEKKALEEQSKKAQGYSGYSGEIGRTG